MELMLVFSGERYRIVILPCVFIGISFEGDSRHFWAGFQAADEKITEL